MELLAILAAVAVAIALFKKVGDLNTRITALEARLAAAPVLGATKLQAPALPTTRERATGADAVSPRAEPSADGREELPQDAPASVVPVATPAAIDASASAPPADEDRPIGPARTPDAPQQGKNVNIDWERTLGVRLPIWGGALMLLIAGFFLLNWAIQAGIASIFTPEIRVGLCALASLALLVAAFVVKQRGIANGDRIAAALATSAIAVGYGTAFLAASIFHLVPGIAALAGASVVTAISIAAAIRFDRRVMLVGLLGGYLSPLFVWVVGTSGDLVPYYVAILLAASLFTIRRFGWWGQTTPALIGPALWAGALMLWTGPITLAAFYLSLAAIPAAVALIPLRNDLDATVQRRNLLQLSVLLSAVLLSLGFISSRYHVAFVAAEVLLSIGGLLLVRLDAAKYRVTWIVTLASALLTLVFWADPDKPTLLGTTLLLGAVHLGALVIQFRTGRNTGARSLEIAALSVVLFLILLVKLDGWIGARDVPYAWAIVALLVAALFAWLAFGRKASNGNRDLPPGFAVATSAFVSLGLGLVLDPGLYALVAALQAFGLSLLYSRFRLSTFKVLHVVYVCLYGVLLAVGQMMSAALFDPLLPPASIMPFVPRVGVEDAPIMLLLLPALLFLAAATVFARVAYSRAPKGLDVGGVALLAAGIHFLILPTIPIDIYQRAFTTGSLWINALMCVAIAAIYGGGRLRRQYLGWAGMGLAALVAVAMLLWAIVPVFSFWPTIPTPGLPIINVALTALGLPAVLMLVAAYLARRQAVLVAARSLAAFGGLAGLITILVVIRQAIHGPTLNGPGLVSLQVELYLYSGGMLLYGFALLWAGAAFSSLALRVGSLVVVLATIIKVFMYDVGGLEGLWRVGSFLGIGIALLAVSWFYGRFVFGIGPSGRPRDQTTAV